MTQDIEASPKKPRRGSFLDYGGRNSIHQFASSYSRVQSYLGSELLSTSVDEDLSPNTSPVLSAREDHIDEEIERFEAEPRPKSKDVGHGHTNIHEFYFPPREPSPYASEGSRDSLVNETTSLFSTTSSSKRKSSLAVGYSTSAQTIFNSINSLMGIGMLTLPFGFKLSGWILGSLLYLSSAVATNYTAKVLGKIIKRNPQIRSYGDIAFLYGGRTFQVLVTGIFSIDLSGAFLSLILLFSDSFNILVPSVEKREWKIIIVSTVFVLSFFPLSVLSLLSLGGILCTLGIIVAIICCGIFIDVHPGSLLSPEPTSWYPVSWAGLFLTMGIFMAPWGGHPVFPEFYRDMIKPAKYDKCANISFSLTFLLTYLIAAIGYLMYGAGCQDSIIKNLLNNEKYPNFVKHLFCFFMGILPVSKLPLVAKPLITVYESILNISPPRSKKVQSFFEENSITRIVYRFVFCSAMLLISLLFNSFGKLVSFLGSAICFTVCLTLPLMFYLEIFKDDLNWFSKTLFRLGIFVSIVGSVVGTYFSITSDI